MNEESPFLGCRVLIHARPHQARTGRVVGAYPVEPRWWRRRGRMIDLSIYLDDGEPGRKAVKVRVNAGDVTVLERPRTDLGLQKWRVLI